MSSLLQVGGGARKVGGGKSIFFNLFIKEWPFNTTFGSESKIIIFAPKLTTHSTKQVRWPKKIKSLQQQDNDVIPLGMGEKHSLKMYLGQIKQ